jgi:hypothetical protein
MKHERPAGQGAQDGTLSVQTEVHKLLYKILSLEATTSELI